MSRIARKTGSVVAALLPFASWQRCWGGQVFLPFYHLVSDENPAHVRPLYPVRTRRQFRNDLDFFLKYFQPISLDELWQHAFEQKTFARPVFHLSFDDGLRECHDVVMPLLLEKGVPATFFLNPDFVDNRGLMFRYKAALLETMRQEGHSLNLSPLRVSYADRKTLDAEAERLGLDFSDFLAREKPYLGTAQIRAMQARGFTFGAHSLDHPVYRQLDLAEQIRQTLGSLQALEQQFGMPLATFAFPFTDDGVRLAFFEKIRADFGRSLLSFGSAGAKRDVAAAHLQRFPMERSTLPAHAAVSGELAYAALRKMLGKDCVART